MIDKNNTHGNIRKWFRNDYNVLCYICGRKRKRSECILAYGMGVIPIVMSCKDGCADALHIRNFPDPIIFDNFPVPNASPQTALDAVSTYKASVFQWGVSMPGYWGGWNLPNDIGNINGICTWGNVVGTQQDKKSG